MRPASAFSGRYPLDTFVYVDGFNLYYGAVKGTPYRWLNIRQLCELLLPKHTILRVKYFTARVSARPGDPDQPVRQQTFLRALATLKDFDIFYGHFLTKETCMPVAGSAPGMALKYEKVIRTDEKGSVGRRRRPKQIGYARTAARRCGGSNRSAAWKTPVGGTPDVFHRVGNLGGCTIVRRCLVRGYSRRNPGDFHAPVSTPLKRCAPLGGKNVI